MSPDLAALSRWIGRTETLHDTVAAAPLQALSATLDRDDPPPQPGDPVPPCWHWLYFLPLHRQSELGPDGHARRGGFLPPVPLPRRMWAGSRIDFTRPLTVGSAIVRTSRIDDVVVKQGRSGALVFVKVRHEIRAAGSANPAIVDEHDIVYRDHPQPGDTPADGVPAPAGAEWARAVVPDDVLLFRYSALTFNGHRIHYDRRWATEAEGYPGLVVHGPLMATLLLDALRRHLPEASVRHFAFRAVKPTFDTTRFHACGRREAAGGAQTARLWIRHDDGALAMDATATLA